VATGETIPFVEALAEAGPAQRAVVIAASVIGLVTAALGVAVFGWEPGDMVVGALSGTAVFGAIYYLWETADMVPRGTLQDAPLSIEVERRKLDRSSLLFLLVAGPLCLAAAWFIDSTGLGAFVFPGQPLGQAVAALVGLVRIRRWERANGRRVLYDPLADKARPLAGAPL